VNNQKTGNNKAIDNGDEQLEVDRRRRGGGGSQRHFSSSSSSSSSKRRVLLPPSRDIEEGVPRAMNSKSYPFNDDNGMEVELLVTATNTSTNAKTSSRTSDRCVNEKRLPQRSVEELLDVFKSNGGKCRKHWMICILLCFIIGVASAIVLGILAARSTKASRNEPQETSTRLIDILPWNTRLAFEYPSSPQSRAFYWLENDPNRDALSLTAALQRFVLATLYYSTAGDQKWQDSGFWLSYYLPECHWFKQEFESVCDAAERFHTLSLPGNSLEGTLPEELDMLSALSIVQFQKNNLVGELPVRIWSSWDHLVLFNVGNNMLSGSLPSEIGLLAEATHLNTLAFQSNQFTGTIPSQIGLLSLDFLSLSENKLEGTIPKQLGLLENARDIYLYGNSLTGTIPGSLGLLSKLTRLELHNNNFSGTVPKELCDLVEFGNLTTLTVDCLQVNCNCGCDCTATGTVARTSIFDVEDGKY